MVVYDASGWARTTTNPLKVWKGTMAALFSSGRQYQTLRCVSCDIRHVNPIKATTHNAGDGDDPRAQLGVRGQDPGACLTEQPYVPGEVRYVQINSTAARLARNPTYSGGVRKRV